MQKNDSLCFKDVGWLQFHALTPASVLDYFALSPFYDRTCNNAALKMQTQFGVTPDLSQLQQQLSQMVGIEYILSFYDLASSIFVLNEQRRLSPQDVTILAVYYVLEGTIYKCPTISNVFQTRLATSLSNLTVALNTSAQLMQHSPVDGYKWRKAESKDHLMDATPLQSETRTLQQRLQAWLPEWERKSA